MEERIKMGVLGGTFDPIHIGHLYMASEVLRQFDLDRIIFVPYSNPFIKQPVANLFQRYKFVELAIRDNENFRLATYEFCEGYGDYTIFTMNRFVEKNPDFDFYYIVGCDAFENIRNWKHWEDLLAKHKFIVTTRPGYDINNSKKIVEGMGTDLNFAEILDIGISSSYIRKALFKDKEVTYLVPDNVLKYIEDNRIYEGIQNSIMNKLSVNLSRLRYEHSLSVRDECINLARHHDLPKNEGDWYKYLIAGLLHDCAKNYCDEMPFSHLSENYKFRMDRELDPFFKDAPWLAHSYYGVLVAMDEYEIFDTDVLNAIECHTFAKADMTNLDKVLYIADFIEKKRPETPVRTRARELAYEDLNEAMKYILKETIKKREERGQPVYYKSKEALEFLERNTDGTRF